jgi:hypothetical protein
MENLTMSTSLALRLCWCLCWYIVPAVLAACAVAVAPGARAAEGGSLEYQLKAALLSKFGLFVDWPATAFSAPGSPLNLCVAGDDPFGVLLDNTVGGQRIGERAIAVRRLKMVGRDSGCHILYVGGSDSQRNTQTIEAVRGGSVLTVTDSGTGGGVGIIDFVIRDNRVRFDINDEAAAQNGLVISSKLLSLALSVKPRRSKEVR